MLWSFLPIAIVVAAAAYIVLVVRRARREQRARSQERAAAMLVAMQGAPTGAQLHTDTAGPTATATAAASTGLPDASAAAPAPAGLAALRRPRFLTDPQLRQTYEGIWGHDVSLNQVLDRACLAEGASIERTHHQTIFAHVPVLRFGEAVLTFSFSGCNERTAVYSKPSSAAGQSFDGGAV